MGYGFIVVDVAKNKAFIFSALTSNSTEIRQSGSTAESLSSESMNLTFLDRFSIC